MSFMLAGQLKKLIEIYRKSQDKEPIYQFEWKPTDLLNLNDKDIELILNNIDRENVCVLMDFLVLSSTKEEKEFFGDLWKFGIENVKTVVVQKIIEAVSIKNSTNILINFNLSGDKFKTIDDFVLYLDLLKKGYISQYVKALINRINAHRADNGEDYYYSEITNYLKNPRVFHERLPYLFLEFDHSQKTEILSFLKMITDEEILYFYIGLYATNINNRVLIENLEKIEKTSDVNLRTMYNTLLKNARNYIRTFLCEEYKLEKESKEKINQSSRLEDIINTLQQFDTEKLHEVEPSNDLNGYEALINLLLVLPYEVWKEIPKNSSVFFLHKIYSNNKLLKDTFSFNCDLITFIKGFSSVSSHQLDKIIKILSSPNFKSLQNRNEILSLILKKENNNAAVLDYIYDILQEYEQTINVVKIKNEIHLEKVMPLLEDGYDIDLVLDKFDDNDEITPNTLVRSLKYKNKRF